MSNNGYWIINGVGTIPEEFADTSDPCELGGVLTTTLYPLVVEERVQSYLVLDSVQLLVQNAYAYGDWPVEAVDLTINIEDVELKDDLLGGMVESINISVGIEGGSLGAPAFTVQESINMTIGVETARLIVDPTYSAGQESINMTIGVESVVLEVA